jgi:hypothetical protein
MAISVTMKAHNSLVDAKLIQLNLSCLLFITEGRLVTILPTVVAYNWFLVVHRLHS